jgi:uncharacterized protein YjbI with pentapeptide repeats
MRFSNGTKPKENAKSLEPNKYNNILIHLICKAFGSLLCLQTRNPSLEGAVILISLALLGKIGQVQAQIDPETGTGTVGGYFIGPGITRSNIDLSNSDLRGANLTGAIFSHVDLSGADLRDANLTNASFSDVDLRNANLAGAIVTEASFSRLKLVGAQTGPLNGSPKFVGIEGIFNVSIGPDTNGKLWIFAPGVRMHGIRVRLGAAFRVWEQDIFHAGIAGTEFINAEWLGDMNPPRSLSTLNLTGLKTSSATITFSQSPPDFTPQLVNPPAGWFFVDESTRVDSLSPTGRNLLLGPGVNFSGGNLSNVSISGKNLSGANFENTNLSGATIRNTNLSGAKLANADLRGLSAYGSPAAPSSLPQGWRFRGGALIGPGVRFAENAGVDFTGQDLSGLDLTGADLRGALLAGAISGGISGTPAYLPSGWHLRNGYLIGTGAMLAGADLRNVNLDGIEIDGVNLDGARLEGASLNGARITGITGTPLSLPTGAGIASGILLGPKSNASGMDLSSANLSGFVLTGANLAGSNLKGSNLSDAQLNGANLTDTNLDDADLRNTNFLLANLTRSRIVGADITGAILFAATLEGLRSRDTVGPPANLPTGGWRFVSGYVLGPNVDLSSDETSGGFLNLNSVSLDGVNLRGSDLRGAFFIQVSLIGADFSDANLSGGTLIANTDCRPALWERVNLSGATFFQSSFPKPSGLAGAQLSPLYISASMFPLDLPTATTAYITDEYDQLFFGPMKEVQIVGPGLNVNGANLGAVNLASSNHGRVFGIPDSLPEGWQLIGGYFLGPQAQLAGANLSGLDLSTANLSGADLFGADITETRFTSTSGESTRLRGVRSGNITGTPLILPPGWSLRGGYLIGQEANLVGANFTSVNLTDIAFSGSNLSGAIFDGAILKGADMDDTLIEGAEFASANLSGLRAKNLSGQPATLPSSWVLRNGYLLGPGVDLSGRIFDENRLWPLISGGEILDLSNANLQGTQFLGQIILSTNLRGADLREADFNGSIFGNCDLSETLVAGMKTSRIGFLTGSGFSGLPDGWNFFLESRSTSFFNLDLGYIIGPGADIGGADFSALDLSGLNAGPMIGVATTLPENWTQVGSFLFGPGAIFGSSDLTGLNLSGTNLDGADLSSATLTRIRSGGIEGQPLLPSEYQAIGGWLVGPDVDLTAADLSEINLQSVDLSFADLSAVRSGGTTGNPSLPSGFRLIDGFLIGPNVDLSGLKLAYLDLTDSNLTGANLMAVRSKALTGTPLLSPGYGLASGHLVGPGVNLSFAVIQDTNLTGLDFTGVNVLGLRSSGLIGNPTLPNGYILANGHLLAPGVDLSGFSLQGADLSGADLSRANLEGVDLRGTSLQNLRSGETTGTPILPWGVRLIGGILFGPGVDLSELNLSHLNLTGTNLRGANFSGVRSSGLEGFPVLSDDYRLLGGYLIGPGVNLADTDLGPLDLRDTRLDLVLSGGTTGTPILPDGYRLEGGYLIGPGVNLNNADLRNLDFRGISLTGAHLGGADLRGALLEGVSSGGISGNPILSSGFRFVGGYILGPGTNLEGIILQNQSLRNIDLSGANLSGADLLSVDLFGANLQGVNFSGAILRSVNFVGANLTDATFDGADGRSLSRSQSTSLPSGVRIVDGTLAGPGIAGRVARFVRFEGYGSSNSNSIELSEIQVYNDGGENLVPGSTLSCNVPHQSLGSLADGVTDPIYYLSTFTFFTTNMAPRASKEAPHRIDIDFGIPQWISEVYVQPFLYSVDYRLFTSLDGESWEPVAPARSDGNGKTEVVPFSTFPNPDFAGADLSGADLRFTNLQGVRSGNTSGQPILPEMFTQIGGYLIGPGAILDGANLADLDLRSANFQGVSARGVLGNPMLPENYHIRSGFIFGPGVNLNGADLRGGLNLGSLNLSEASFVGANLSGADLRNSNLFQSDFSESILNGVQFQGVSAFGARFSNALFTFATYGTGAFYDDSTDFDGALLISASAIGPAVPLVPEPPNWILVAGDENSVPTFSDWVMSEGLPGITGETVISARGQPLLLHYAMNISPNEKIPASRLPRIDNDPQGDFSLLLFTVPKNQRGMTFTPEITELLTNDWRNADTKAVRYGEDEQDIHYLIAVPKTSRIFFRLRIE